MINWSALGVEIGNIDGWTFSVPESNGYQGTLDSGPIIHTPVGLRLSMGHLNFDRPGDWRQYAHIEGDILTLKLPLKTQPGTRVIIVPPPQGFLSDLQGKIHHLSTTHDDTNPTLTVVLRLLQETFTIEANQPIAQMIPLGSGFTPIITSSLPTPQAEHISSGDFTLKVWRLDPKGVRIEPAEKTLRGDAPSGAVRWCGPFNHANAYGFWIYPPIDIDIIWYGGRSYDYNIITPHSDEDIPHMKSLHQSGDPFEYNSRKKIDFGGVLDPVVSIWTGCVFQTPPGWGLLIRNPINVAGSYVYRVQEGILETDWLPYDIWMNLQFMQQNKWVHIRKDDTWPPIAQIIPVPREAYEPHWKISESMMERSTPEGQDIFNRWLDYNHKKWLAMGGKEPYTYHRERARYLKRNPDLPKD